MEPRSLDFITRACGGRLLHGSPSALVKRVSTDSRQVETEDLFVAISGPNFDGHTFVAEADRKGAAAVMISRAKPSPVEIHCAVIMADNPRQALGQLAERYRQDFNLPLIAVGGSNGKTSTKDLLAAVLGRKLTVLRSDASFNNDIGVPLTLLRLNRHHEVGVLEVGTNHPGELPPLVRMIQPKVGVITSIGQEHLEFFGNIEGVAQEEGWLAELLPEDGTLFLNGDHEWTDAIERRCPAEVVRVGFGQHNHWRASEERLQGSGMRFTVTGPCPDYNGHYSIQIPGRHQVGNALLALAVGAAMGIPPEEARIGLADCPASRMRMQLWETGGVRILDDGYNANLDSMTAALATLKELPCPGRRIAVLGDLAELGDQTEPSQREVGRLAAQSNLDLLMTVGQWAAVTAQAARQAGLVGIEEYSKVPEAAARLKELIRPGDLILLKASRSSGFERIGTVLRGST